MPIRAVAVLAQEFAEPPDTLAADDVVGVDLVIQVRYIRYVSTHHDACLRQVLPYELAHLANLKDI